MPPNIVPGWPPQRGQRIDQGLFNTYSIGPAAGGPGGGPPGIGNPQLVDPQQRKMLIPPGGGVGGGGGPGGGDGLSGGELFSGMGGSVFGGLGEATGAMLPGIGMVQGGGAGEYPTGKQAPETPVDDMFSFGTVDAYQNFGMGAGIFGKAFGTTAIPPPAPPFSAPPGSVVGSDGRAWTPLEEGLSQSLAGLIGKDLPEFQRALTRAEIEQVMKAITVVAEAVSFTQDEQLQDRITQLQVVLRLQEAEGDIRAGCDRPTIVGTGGSDWLGVTIPSGIPLPGMNTVIWLHKVLFEDGRFQKPCSRAFVRLIGTVVHEARHAAGSKGERVPAASAMRALRALKDNITKVRAFDKCTLAELIEVVKEIDEIVKFEEGYGGLKNMDPARYDRDPERRPGRGQGGVK